MREEKKVWTGEQQTVDNEKEKRDRESSQKIHSDSYSLFETCLTWYSDYFNLELGLNFFSWIV